MRNKIFRSLPLLAIIALAAFLRLFLLNQHPIGLNADEAAIGYNAYSLIETGRDEHGASWPLAFRSFDDYKPPVYFYLVLPFVKVLGLTVWAIRLPSALLGVASVFFLYLLTQELFKKTEFSPLKLNLGHLAALLLAISPWHLHFSRGGWEVNAATFFLILGLWAFIQALKKPVYFFLFVLSFALSLYTYHSLRIVAPLIGLYLLITNINLFRHRQSRTWLLASLIFGLLLVIPLAYQTLSGTAASRFSGVSIFADPGPLAWVHEMRRTSANPDSLLTKLLYNRYSAYTGDFLKNYFSHFSPDFLFISGDEIARSKVPDFGQSYLWTLPFFALGLWFFIKNLKSQTGLILFWLLVGVIPAALTFQSPHALRSQNISLPLQIVIAAGIYQLYLWLTRINFKKITLPVFTLIIVFVASFGLYRYANAYYIRYPLELGYAWQPGFDQLAAYLTTNQDRFDQVVISTRYDQPYILVAFFLKTPPDRFQKELVFSTPDRFGFSTGLSFGKYAFRPITDADLLLPNALIVVADEAVSPGKDPDATINYPNGTPVFRLYSTKK